jgi:Zn-dependent M28 family amino/carboxypeptidase
MGGAVITKLPCGLKVTTAAAMFVLGSCALGAESGTTTGKVPAASARAEIHLDTARIRAHVEYLTSDRLEGRRPGGRGGDLAADYIAKQFASYGLDPAGDDGTYFQKIPMVEVTTLSETSFTVVDTSLQTVALRNLEDFVANNQSQAESSYLDAPIVFLGYGIQAPENQWDDYKDADLSGKVVLLLAGTPRSGAPGVFSGRSATDYGGWAYKFETAARHGALGALLIQPIDMAGDGWQAIRDSWGMRRAYLQPDTTPRLQAASWLRSEAAGKLTALAGLDLGQLSEQAQSREFRPKELALRLQAHLASRVRPFMARNVLAVRLTYGSESEEAVLYTAQYDHSGVEPTVKGHLYKGAVDDAAGCGVLLEVARAWARTGPAPPRMILFAALTAEEQGLLGSQYLVKHLPVLPGKVTLALNYDGFPPPGEREELVVSGAERTTFFPAMEVTAKALGFTIRPDPSPEEGSYYRSSPINLARAGVPAFTIAGGERFATEHHVAEVNFTGAAKFGTLGYQLGAKASALPGLLGWVPGDAFEAERRRSQSAEQLSRKPPLRLGKRKK